MIHEVFSPIRDIQLAKTCSEIFTGDYHFAQADTESAQYGAGPELLTNPDVQLLAAQASYLEGRPDGSLGNFIKFATFGPELPPLERITEVYADSIGRLQGWGSERLIVTIMAGIQEFQGGWEAANRWYGNEVAKTGRSLLSAYFLGRVSSENETLVEMLAYPEHIRQSLRLLIRDRFIATLPTSPPELQVSMRDTILDNQRLYTIVGDIRASNQLLSPENFEGFLGPHLQRLANEDDV